MNQDGIAAHSALIGRNLSTVMKNIGKAASRAGRDPAAVTLLVVSKGQTVEVLRAAVQAGVTRFGENYAEQAVPKIEALRHIQGLEWHMIGHVQGRKAGIVCSHFDMVHSVDSVRLAERLNRLAGENGKRIRILLELNLGGEETKSGWRVSTPSELESILPDVLVVTGMPNILVNGLMTMPPLADDPEAARPFFSNLRRMAAILDREVPSASWKVLSMGTSSDYETAVEEGATIVRIGQAILGPRPPRE